MTARNFIMHTDGGARGNPGPGAIGVIIEEDGKVVDAFGRFLGEMVTNNQAEYRAVEAALLRARELGGGDITVYLDSELVASQLRREFKIKDARLGQLFVRVWNLIQGFRSVRFVTIPREENNAADGMVNQALDAAGK